MTQATEQKVATQLFVGCMITPDIRIAMNQSKTWRQAQIGVSDELKEQPYQGKDYLGTFVSGQQIPLPQIDQVEKTVRERLRHYCPSINSDAVAVYVLSILLIS